MFKNDYLGNNQILTTFTKKFFHNNNTHESIMKKIIQATPLALLFSIFILNANLEAAGCSSHQNKKVQVECSTADDNCDNLKSDKKFNKVDA